jgi:hypothetical protein
MFPGILHIFNMLEGKGHWLVNEWPDTISTCSIILCNKFCLF